MTDNAPSSFFSAFPLQARRVFWHIMCFCSCTDYRRLHLQSLFIHPRCIYHVKHLMEARAISRAIGRDTFFLTTVLPELQDYCVLVQLEIITGPTPFSWRWPNGKQHVVLIFWYHSHHFISWCRSPSVCGQANLNVAVFAQGMAALCPASSVAPPPAALCQRHSHQPRIPMTISSQCREINLPIPFL